MAMNASDLLDVVAEQLQRAGYTFHQDETDVPPVPGCVPEARHWFTWTDGINAETSDDFSGAIEAQAGALEHHFTMAWGFMDP